MNESKQSLQIHEYFRSYLLLFVNMFLILTYSNKTCFIRIGKQLKKLLIYFLILLITTQIIDLVVSKIKTLNSKTPIEKSKSQ